MARYEALLGNAGWGVRNTAGDWLSDGYDTEREAWDAAVECHHEPRVCTDWALLSVGDRVRLTHEVWRYPHFIAECGQAGTVTYVSHDMVAVRMDAPVKGAEEWDNEVHWYPCNGDDLSDLMRI
jgi:hypothetical protein